VVNQDATFRTAVVLAVLAVLPVTLYHRLRSQATGEKLDRRQEGLFILATLRPVGVAHMLGVFAYMVNPAWMAWSSVPLPSWLRWTGGFVCVPASGLLIWTLRGLGMNLTDTVVTRRGHTLITQGAYRWVRHPFYVAVALLIGAISLMAANGFLLLTGGLVLLLIVVRTRKEEENLVARFGDAYRAYMTETGRFLPKMRTDRRGA